MTVEITPNVDALIMARGAATPAELGLEPDKVLALAKKRPDLEPVFLVRFRSRQGKVRVEEVRAYAWPSQQLSLRHLGYQAEDRRLLRLEPRQPVPFPQRLYTRFQDNVKVIEELRTLEKNYTRAVKQASSKPGRCEMDLTPLQVPFKKLGDDVVLEMWIDAASIFQRIDNQNYAAKMLGNLLKVAEKSKVEPSLLARTVLSAADDGVFNTKLYEYTWALLAKKSTQTALGFGLRVFRRLMTSGRPLPTDFIKDLRNGALKGKVTDFEPLFDSTVLWATGLSSFWNTAKKGTSWRSEATADHKETGLLRDRFVQLWIDASKSEDGEAWKAGVWERVKDVNAEFTVYGRLVVVERLLEMLDKQGTQSHADHSRLLEATLALLARSPSSSDRARVEDVALKAFVRLAKNEPDLLWNSSGVIEDGLRAASGQLTSFVTLCDLLCDVSELLSAREGKTLLESMPGLTTAWTAALVSALAEKKKSDDDDDDDDDADDSGSLPIVTLIGETLARYTPETAPEQLAELGPLLAKRIATDLSRGESLEAWERVLGTLRRLGPIGEGILADATARFIKTDGTGEDFRYAAGLVHLLDKDLLRPCGEARSIVDEALENVFEVAPLGVETTFAAPDGLGNEVASSGRVAADGNGFEVLFTGGDGDDDKPRPLCLCHVGLDGKLAVIAAAKHTYSHAVLWVSAEGVRVVTGKDRIAQVLDSKLKVLKKFEVEEDFGGRSYGDVSAVAYGQDLLVTRGSGALVIDAKLNVVGENEATERYGDWSLLAGPPGSAAVVVFKHSSEVTLFTASGQKAPALKLPDGGSVQYLGRLEDGSLFADYTNKKHVRRRARLGADGQAWTFADATAELTVLDTVEVGTGLPFDVRGGSRLGYASGSHNGAAYFDWLGRPLGCSLGMPGKDADPVAINLEAGVLLYPHAVIRDGSLAARLSAAEDLRAALTKTPGEVLPRALYRDAAGLAAHLLAEVAKRPAGQAALTKLGDATAATMMAGLAQSTGKLLVARATVLDAIDAPPAQLLEVPRRSPGVSRTEVRRAIRETFSGNELAFWALDAREPGPFVRQFIDGDELSDSPFSTLRTLLKLVQNPKTSLPLASRALETAEALIAAVKNPKLVFELDQSGRECNRNASMFGGGSGPFLFPNRGSYQKKVAPVPLVEGEGRKPLLAGWIEKSLLAGLAPKSVTWRQEDSRSTIIKDDHEDVDQFAAKVTFDGLEFLVFPAARRSADGLEWWLDGIEGKATPAQWSALCEALAASVNACQPQEVVPVWPDEYVRSSDIETIARCVAFSRESLGRRETLSPDAWPAPPAEGALKHLDERQRKWVLLAWVFETLDADKVGTTAAAFEALAKQCKFVEKSYRGLRPKLGDKTGDDVPFSQKFRELRINSFIGSGWGDLLVMRDPAELVLELASAAGLTGDVSEKRVQK